MNLNPHYPYYISSKYFIIMSPWKRHGPSFEPTWIPFTQGYIVPSLVEIGPVVLEKKIFLISSMYFRYFLVISFLWKRVGPFIWTNLNPHHQRMICAKFGWNWPSGSGKEDENVKSLLSLQQRQQWQWQQTTDKFWSEKPTWAFSSGELKQEHVFFLYRHVHIINCWIYILIQRMGTRCILRFLWLFIPL